MDLSLGTEYEAFRAEVTGFLAASWDKSRNRDPGAVAAFRATAIEQGYLYRSIPRAFGGSEQAADPLRARVIREAFACAGAPGELSGPGPSMLVPTLLARGTDWQKHQFIRRTLLGEIVWCQGYSEPNAGSDLASLRTRAAIEGGEWVINGQKVWTTDAHRADLMFVLARTDPAAPKHQGISYLLVAMKQPGITVRPLRQMTGGSEFNEVFLDDARTPLDWIVGQPGEGWSVSKSTLKFERDNLAGTDRIEQQFASLVSLARKAHRSGQPMIERDDVRQALAKIEAHVLAQKYASYRQTSMNLAGREPGLIDVLGKINGSNIARRIATLSQDLIGADGLAMPGERRHRGGDNETARAQSKWVNQIMGSLAMAIAGGTSNVQRGVIAERGLGLPRDADMRTS
jgi:alkylation response protein AidB-like acyl-CoA dehydrogenase